VAAPLAAALPDVHFVAVALVGNLDAGAAVCDPHQSLAWRINPQLGLAIYLIPSAVWLTVSGAITALETKHTYAEPLTRTSFLERFGRVVPLAALGTGMLAHQVNAFAEGLFGPLNSEFERTPKAASVTRRETHHNALQRVVTGLQENRSG
jgi:hypothetical protein